MTISKREKILILIVVLLALFGAYYLYYLKPCIDDIQSLKLDNESKELQLSADEMQQSQLVLMQSKVDDIDTQLASYGDFAQAFDQPPVLVYISDTVQAAAQKGSISFMQPEQIGQIARCAITITMSCTYDGLKKILEDFSGAPYLLRVTQLSAVIPVADPTSTNAGNDTATNSTNTEGDTASATSVPTPGVLNITMVLDFYSLAGEIPEDTVYAFNNNDQHDADIFS